MSVYVLVQFTNLFNRKHFGFSGKPWDEGDDHDNNDAVCLVSLCRGGLSLNQPPIRVPGINVVHVDMPNVNDAVVLACIVPKCC